MGSRSVTQRTHKMTNKKMPYARRVEEIEQEARELMSKYGFTPKDLESFLFEHGEEIDENDLEKGYGLMVEFYKRMGF